MSCKTAKFHGRSCLVSRQQRYCASPLRRPALYQQEATSDLTAPPEREHEYSAGTDTHTGDEVCRYVSCDNCDLKITHTSPQGIFPPPQRDGERILTSVVQQCDVTQRAVRCIDLNNERMC